MKTINASKDADGNVTIKMSSEEAEVLLDALVHCENSNIFMYRMYRSNDPGVEQTRNEMANALGDAVRALDDVLER